MMPLQLYFPDGVPEGYERILNPDEVSKSLLAGMGEMEVSLFRLSKKARDILHNKRPWWSKVFRHQPEIDSEWLHTLLFSESDWPSVDSKTKKALRFYKRLLQLDPSGHRPMFPRGDAPTQDQIKQSLDFLSKEASRLMGDAYKAYRSTLKDVAKEILPVLCETYAEEECSLSDAEALVNADLYDMKDINRFPGLSPQMEKYLISFLDYLDA